MNQRNLNSKWDSLRPGLVDKMRVRLSDDFDYFTELCEDIGLLDNFVSVSESALNDLDFSCSMCASAIVSAANHYGGRGDVEISECLALWALLLEPNHLPALKCLSTIYEVTLKPYKFAAIQRRSEEILGRLSSTPKSQLSSFEIGMLEALGH